MAGVERPTTVPWWARGHGCADLYTPRDAANMRRSMGWLIAWTFSFGVATVLLGKHLVRPLPAAIGLALVPTLVGIGVIRAFLAFLREADELVRKIQVEALAWGFGAGAVFMLGYRLLERIGAPQLDIVAPFVVMLLATGIGQYAGRRRYL